MPTRQIKRGEESPGSEIVTVKKPLTCATGFSTNTDTLIVEKRSAIFILPDSLQIENRKKQVGEEAFYAGADDYLFHMNAAQEYLESRKLMILEAKHSKFIKFVSANKTQLINLENPAELWNIYFFDPAKQARVIDMTLLEEEFKSYFN